MERNSTGTNGRTIRVIESWNDNTSFEVVVVVESFVYGSNKLIYVSEVPIYLIGGVCVVEEVDVDVDVVVEVLLL